jgi:putative glutamine amidotransferase
LLHDALSRDLPVLGVCRGHQLLNVALGGKLLQHIESGEHEDVDRISKVHEVSLSEGSRLREIYAHERIVVNSRHHQAVTPDLVAPGLRVTGVTDDGLVEGLESDSHSWVVSVQWHPERPDAYIEGFAGSSALLWRAFADVVSRSRV